MKACELISFLENGVNELFGRLDRIDERIVNVDGRAADIRSTQVFADLELSKRRRLHP